MSSSERPADGSESRVPRPPHPQERREPLPGHLPKPNHEDPGAAERVEAILASPSYRQADGDLDFLAGYETRGVRLQIDYLKPELHMAKHGVVDTVVVFGSTRIVEPASARSRLEKARKDFAREQSAAAREKLAIAERILEKSHYYEVAREFGALVGAAGDRPEGQRLAIVTGGGPGIMEAANRGAFDVGAQSVGLNITLPREQFPNPYVTPDLCFSFHYFALRKLHFLLRARALVAFPGGYGTFDELFETLTLVQTRKIAPLPIVLVGESYWRRAFDVDFLVDEGVIAAEDRELFWYAETAEQIWRDIRCWHERAGKPLAP
ncbi:MAG: TIGR00730 family Rossman fold protein [Methylocystaceae bacterium]|nr:MAG: TIGR00730 family Rossman fold protein [Methylocystaceae bacterium]